MTYERLETERIEEDVDNQSTTIEGVIASNDGASNENNLVYGNLFLYWYIYYFWR